MCLCCSHPIYLWQLELTVNRTGPEKGKRLFPHTSDSPLLQKIRVANRRFSSLDSLQTYHPVILFFPGSVMSLGPTCNDSHVIKKWEALNKEREGSKGVPISDRSCSPFVKLSALVHPWVIPWGWRARQMDITDGWTPFPRLWTQTHTSQTWFIYLVMFTERIWYHEVAAWLEKLVYCVKCM